MKEKKKDRDIVKDAIGDPAFYNDQIDKDRNPAKTLYDNKKGDKRKPGI